MSEKAILARHADKGGWIINAEELRQRVSPEDANLIESVLQASFPDLEKTPLSLDGLARSLRLGDKLFEKSDDKSVIVSINSKKDRAELCNALAVARVAWREAQYNSEHKDAPKRIDMLQVEEDELVKLLADSSPDTWGPYDDMMKKEGISESEAIARWLNDMNAPTATVENSKHPRESAERYRKLIQQLTQRVTSEHVPVTVLGIGHSGSLGQVRYEAAAGQPMTAEDTPQFCEMHNFDANGTLLDSERVSL